MPAAEVAGGKAGKWGCPAGEAGKWTLLGGEAEEADSGRCARP
jgi:hypothetical protein